MKLSVKLIDILIILIAVSLIIFSVYLIYGKPSGRIQVLIQGQNSQWIFNPESDETVSVTGPIGHTIVRVAGGAAWVESSPCDNQNCTAAGFIRKQGQWAACLPNLVMVMIQGDGGAERSGNIDAISW